MPETDPASNLSDAPAPVETDSINTGAPPTYTSRDLLQGNVEIQIVHGEDIYRLRRTSRDKLILQK